GSGPGGRGRTTAGRRGRAARGRPPAGRRRRGSQGRGRHRSRPGRSPLADRAATTTTGPPVGAGARRRGGGRHRERSWAGSPGGCARHGGGRSGESSRPPGIYRDAACPTVPWMRCGADTGGTFTDLVADDGRVLKVLSTPDDPARATATG